MRILRGVVTIIVAGIIIGLAYLIKWIIWLYIGSWSPGVGSWLSWFTGLLFVLILLAKFLYSGVKIIPNEPPNKAVLAFLGKRKKIILDEGWYFLPLYPFIFDAICIDVRKVNQDLDKQIAKTPDLADLIFNISITWTPGGKKNEEPKEESTTRTPDGKKNEEPKEDAELFINFLNSGGEERVKTILHDIIKDRLRIWAFSGEEGPANWQEAVAARDDVMAVIIKAILGEDIPSVSSPIPTSVLLKYFDKPSRKPLSFEKNWGRKSKNGNMWEGLENELKSLSNAEFEKLEKEVEKRREIISKVRRGNGSFVNKALGITINRFTINDVALADETVAMAVASQVREKHEQIAERTEINHVISLVKKLTKELSVSPETGLEVSQTERGKVSKTIQEKKGTISEETLKTVKESLGEILSFLIKK